jgi:hypothetical protein
MRLLFTALAFILLMAFTPAIFAQTWMSAGGSFNQAESVEVSIGHCWESKEGLTLPRKGTYFQIGLGTHVSYDDLVFLGSGFMAGLNKPYSKNQIGHWILIGGEFGDYGPNQQDRYAGFRVQYLVEMGGVKLGVGYLIGTFPGFTVRICGDIGDNLDNILRMFLNNL